METKGAHLLPANRSQDEVRKILLIFRWLLIIVCSTMVVFSHTLLTDVNWAHLFVILLIASNAALHFVPSATLTKPSFYSAVALIDIVLITIALLISGQTATDFYMVYFIVIMISALSQELTQVVVSTVLIILLYGLVLLLTNLEMGTADPLVLLRFPFFFIIALFYGFLVQSVHEERQRKERLAQEEVNRLKAQFLGLITQELLGPMNLVMGYIHLMLTGTAGSLNLEQIRIMDQFQLNAEKLLNLIRQLVELSNIETKRVTLNIRKGQIKPFLKDLHMEIRPQLQEKPVRIEFIPDDDLPGLETDWSTLRQAMLHVLANAISSTDSGQISVMARKGPGEEEATLAVVNTGSEVRKEDVPALFANLSRMSAERVEYDGLGVGIAIAKNLLTLVGAQIQIIKTGKGSDFTITIPSGWGEKPREVVGISYVEPFKPT
ncbi:MAG: sensor histidine kinase [Candidatus Binatia bacterium]